MFGQYLRSARYYHLSQIAARFRLGISSSLIRKSPWWTRRQYAVPGNVGRDLLASFLPAVDTECSEELAAQQENAGRLGAGRFKLLNEEVTLGFPVPWQPSQTGRLWRYNLHYFDYALDLAMLVKWRKDEQAAGMLARLFREWIEGNRIGHGVGWHSYPIARRIVNWIHAFSLASPSAIFENEVSETKWLTSLYQQTRYLEGHLEYDCLGNHLLANGKALVFAGLFFGGNAGLRWYSIGQRILWRGLQDQLLEDGGHQERSPMYHSIVLQDYLEVVLALKLNGREVPNWVRTDLISMGDLLSGIRHPDGEIPLFGDSAFGIAHRPGDILAAAERLLDAPRRWPGTKPGLYCDLIAPQANQPGKAAEITQEMRSSWPATGYFVLPGEGHDDRLIVDAKPMGPDHLPAHGHCSLFSYELSIRGERLIVDSGVGTYEPGAWRTFWRSTRAHNTVVADGAEQFEIWASFRVGERTHLSECEFLQGPTASIFVGAHSGFAGQKAPTQQRRFIAALAGGYWMVLDEINGRGRHAIESLVHLASNAAPEVGEAYTNVTMGLLKLRFHPFYDQAGLSHTTICTRGQLDPIQGWYAPEFGKKMPNSVLSFSTNSTLPAKIGYLIAPADREVSSWSIEVNDLDRLTEVHISVSSPEGNVVEQFSVPRRRVDPF
ncbi:MAG: alginate lyase family protein [Terracidiphilus sp.]